MRKRARAAPAAGLAGSLFGEIRARPGRLPESLASFALRRLGPGAGATVDRLRGARPGADDAALRALVVARGRRAVATEGAFVGGPFLLFVPFAFCGALLSQARTVLELAAVEGRDPTDPERAAELLVLQGVYEDLPTARASLTALLEENGPGAPEAGTENGPAASQAAEEDAGGTDREAVEGGGAAVRGAAAGPGRVAVLFDLVMRMARLLGLLTPDAGGGPLARLGHWALVGVVFLAGLVAPLVWLPYMAVSYLRATRRLMDRATVFYVGDRDLRAPRGLRMDPAVALAALRAAGSLLLPALGLFVVVASDTRIADGRWPVAGIVLTSSCLLTGGWWQWRRHRRRGKRAARPAGNTGPT
ncbi:hypothetical protein [Streptomyces sp. NPDC094049]|uniref:hypothetical protein n=1 Tax=Streptomyces sp. NPDC094049 TaxID=3154987 RepID=UPI003323F9EE